MNQSLNTSIRRWSRSFFGKLFIVFCLLSLNINIALAVAPASTTHPENENHSLDSASITSSDMGLMGPFSFGVGYGTLNQFNINAQYTKKINEAVAISGLVEYGPETYRFGGTLGLKLLENDLIKFSAEQFNQLLPFSFSSGNVDERVSQNAYGARYQHTLPNAFFKTINVGGYYANAPNDSLDPIIFSVDDVAFINYRNIAGGTSTGMDTSTDVQITPSTEISAQLYYDNLRYDTKYTDNSPDDARGLGGGLGVKQLLTERLVFSAVGSVRKIYNTYTVGFSWLPHFLSGSEISLLGQRIITHNETPNSSIFGLQFGYDFGVGGRGAQYALSSLNTTSDVGDWTATPAVYMDQVLAISDEFTELLAVEQAEGPPKVSKELPASTSSISPVSGPLEGGTSVVITGTELSDVGAVKFGNTDATSFTIDSSTQITAISPSNIAGAVEVIIQKSSEKNELMMGEFTYEALPMDAAVPKVTALTPNAGPLSGGTSVVIKGSGLTNTVSVQFGSTNATGFTVDSGTQITAIAPAGTGVVNVTVTTPSGTSATSASNQFTYQGIPVITSISPNAGAPAGNTLVTINGTNLLATSSVLFGATPATNVTVVNATQVTAKSPAGTTGTTVDIIVTTNAGTSATTSADQFIYEDAPTITGISPNAGSPAGGTTVVITGTNFSDALGISFGSVFAPSYSVDSPTQITLITPANDAGTANVRVTTPVGTSSITTVAQYTYETAPVITSVSPNAGDPAGSTSVVINGSNFTDATAVYFGSQPATSFKINNASKITAVSPAGSQGSTVDITVVTPLGTSPISSVDQYVYEAAPTITSMSPNTGLPAGGTTVIITGTNFTNTVGVSFGSAFATYTINSPTQMTVVAPANSAGTVNVRVTTPVGTSAVTTAAHYIYQDLPVITSLTPDAGVPSGGTSVVLTGTNFTNASAVNFGSQSATSFTVNSATKITAIAPAGTLGSTVDITVTTPVGTSLVSSSDQYTYEGTPTITGISPNVGLPAGGNTVVITGTNFTDDIAVNFGTAFSTTFTVDSATQVTAVVPANPAGTSNVRVTTPVGTSVIVPASIYTYENAPTVTNVSPDFGISSGGTAVTITGTNFTNVTGVNFGSQSAASFTINSATTITAVSPPGTEDSTIDITVISPVGGSAISTADQFSYLEIPTVTSVSPNAGLPAGGTSVILSGTHFMDATAVTFGSTSATSFTINSDTQITAISPSGTGTVDITVSSLLGTSPTSSADQFLYEGTPTVTAVSPHVGPLTGGTTIVINGTNFTDATAVNFGSTAANSFTINNDTQITAVAPSGSSIVNVTVTTPVGTSMAALSNEYIYQGVPTIIDISPNAGMISGGTTVVINGTNFLDTNTVLFGSTPATNINIISPTQLTAQSPSGSAGTVDVTVITSSGTSSLTSADQFTYEGIPTITNITPNAGSPSGGQSIVITGTNFTNALGVSFGSAFASSFTVDSPTQITVITPSNTEGAINVRVTTPVGTNAMTPAAQYTYENAPTVTNILPNAGLPAGGTPVVITGTNFIDASAVNFGTTPAASFTLNSATQITAISPAGTEGNTSDITVTTPVGTSSVSSADQFTYEDIPTLTSISPNAGLPEGGTTVILTGTNFTDDIAINFGSTFATTFTVDSPTQITAIAPANPAGTANVRVTTPVGTSVMTLAAQYTYENVPAITEIFPNAGGPSGGTTTVITGTDFINATAVNFDSVPALSFVVDSATQITAISPPGTQGDTVDITVTTPVGTSTVVSGDQFNYEGPPTITNISPNAGVPEGGTTVVITGTNFTDDLAVNFGTVFASTFTVDSPTQVTVITPANTAGTSHVRVTTPVGTSVITPDTQYTYETVPVVSNISPNAGVPAGGTPVLITGSNFTNTESVNFGLQSATSFIVNSDSQITAISPAGVADSVVHVTVTTPVGTSATSSADLFNYDPPTITSISPSHGVSTGGTVVIINGSDFNNIVSVKFGSVHALHYSVNDSFTQIIAIAPPGTIGITVDIQVTTTFGVSPIIPGAKFTYVAPSFVMPTADPSSLNATHSMMMPIAPARKLHTQIVKRSKIEADEVESEEDWISAFNEIFML